MASSSFDLDVFAAEWALELISPENVPEIACDALMAGHDSRSLRRLAGLTRPSRVEISELVNQFIRELGMKPFSKQDAGDFLARRICRQIVSGEITPHEGAIRIWRHVYQNCGGPRHLIPFVGLGSECEDKPHLIEAYREQIILAAQELLEKDSPL